MTNVDTSASETPETTKNNTSESTPAKAKRPAVTERTWLKGNEEIKDPREATAVKIEVMGSGDIVADPSEFSTGVQNALTLFGLNIVLTNTMGGLRGDEAFEAMMSRLETLQAGEWTSRKGAEGPRISQLVQALFNIYEKAGEPRSMEALTEAVKTKDEEWRKATAARPNIKAELDRLRAEAAAKRAAESAAKAGEAGVDEGLTGLGL